MCLPIRASTPRVNSFPIAYTRYSFFEWSLIVLDILYDSVLASDLRAANIRVGFLLLHKVSFA